MGSAHRAGGTPPSEGGVPPGRWEAVGRLPRPSGLVVVVLGDVVVVVLVVVVVEVDCVGG